MRKGVNLTVQDLLRQDARVQDLYFNISEMKLSILLLFSVQIMSYLRASDIIHTAKWGIEVQILDPCVLAQKILDREIHTVYMYNTMEHDGLDFVSVLGFEVMFAVLILVLHPTTCIIHFY